MLKSQEPQTPWLGTASFIAHPRLLGCSAQHHPHFKTRDGRGEKNLVNHALIIKQLHVELILVISTGQSRPQVEFYLYKGAGRSGQSFHMQEKRKKGDICEQP